MDAQNPDTERIASQAKLPTNSNTKIILAVVAVFALAMLLGGLAVLGWVLRANGSGNSKAKEIVNFYNKARNGENFNTRYARYATRQVSDYTDQKVVVTSETIASRGKAVETVLSVKSARGAEPDGPKVKVVFEGDTAYVDLGGQSKPLEKDGIAFLRNQVYAEQISYYLEESQLEYVGSESLDRTPIECLMIKHVGFPDVKLSFDKLTGLLLKAAMTAGNTEGVESRIEFAFSNYKAFDGVMFPQQEVLSIDGKEQMKQTLEMVHPLK